MKMQTRHVSLYSLSMASSTSSPFRSQPKASWLALVLLLVFGACGLWVIIRFGSAPAPYPVDAYYYLAKAENLRDGRGLTTYWNDGLDRKFFPLQSIALAALVFLRYWWPSYWLALSVLAYAVNGVVLWKLLRRIEPSEPVRFATLAFWLCNPNVLLWSSVPYAEGLASALAWGAVAVCARGWRNVPARRFLAAALLGGLAVTARPEAVALALAFAILVMVQAAREGRRAIPWRRLAAGAALFAAPFAAYWLSLPSATESPRLLYVHEFFERFSPAAVLDNFLDLLYSILMEKGVEIAFLQGQGAWPALGALRYGIDVVFALSLLLALAGRLGRLARWTAAGMLGYQLLHALWHYAYGRFDYPVVPLAAYIFASGLAALFRIGRRGIFPIPPRGVGLQLLSSRSAAYFAAAAAIAATMALYGVLAIMRQQYFISRMDVRVPSQVRAVVLAQLVTSLGEGDNYLCSTADLWLAYGVGSMRGARAWFEEAKPDFGEAPFAPEKALDFMERRRISWIVTRRSLEKWLDDYHIPVERRAEFVPRLETPQIEVIERIVGQ